eukprot:TRINITY_DN82236_c0_g1_i1.p1 TRINITY_DN82236_c0_g1~~TRINITY_DN82236_c0_g1_i1.p1  ORF type:complete len:381 (-),score=105.63 TRINITY_DN82236_c0_g1_i1:214-1356(-)
MEERDEEIPRMNECLRFISEQVNVASLRKKKCGTRSIVLQMCPSLLNQIVDEVLKVVPMCRPGDGEKDATYRTMSIELEVKLLEYFKHLCSDTPSQTDESSFTMTPRGSICCEEFVPRDDMVTTCKWCGLKNEDHVRVESTLMLLKMKDRGMSLEEFVGSVRDAMNSSNKFSEMQLYEFVDGIISCVLTELFAMWDAGYAHRNLTMENVVINDLFRIDQIAVGKSDIEAHILGFGSARSLDFRERMQEPPMESLSGSPELFRFPSEMALLEREDDFIDSAEIDLRVIDIECVKLLMDILLSEIVLPFFPTDRDIGVSEEADYVRIQNMRQPEDFDPFFWTNSKQLLQINRHIFSHETIPFDVKIEMLKKVIARVQMEPLY